ncbi:MAG TPA: hypothetical protein VFW12_08950 [Candidatus Limnocylindria bacterium]|nr:hypothetical protein [Candidatus Limnocylindria bacterium]
MRVLLIVVVLASSCVPSPAAAPSPAPTDAPSVIATEAPTATPAAAAAPAAAAPPPLREPAVAVASDPFPIVSSLALRPSLNAEDVAHARRGVDFYLMALNNARDNGSDPAQYGLTGAFKDAVVQGLRDSATPGVKRQLVLESIRVDRFLVKPWGVPALAEVTATIVDRVVEGSGSDQRETGRLRLTGERLRVTDAWDYVNVRWFNGLERPSPEMIRTSVGQTVASFLRFEQWAPGSPKETWREGEPTPFSAAWTQRLVSIDRTQTVARSFEAVRATVERFDTFAEHGSGIATVRMSGTVVTVDAHGQTTRSPFERRVKAFLFGGWAPEVVDEEVAPGVWLAGGDLALHLIDVNRA